MIIAGEVYKRMSENERNTVRVLGAISALCTMLSVSSFNSSVKHEAQSYLELGNDSYETVQGVLIFVAMIALFALKLYAATTADAQKAKAKSDAQKPVTFAKQPKQNPVAASVAVQTNMVTSTAPLARPSELSIRLGVKFLG